MLFYFTTLASYGRYEYTDCTSRSSQSRCDTVPSYIRSTEYDIDQIVLPRKKIEEAWSNFERVQAEIEELNCIKGRYHSAYIDEFENIF